MSFLVVICSVFGVLYAIFGVYLIVGWTKSKDSSVLENLPETKFSVIVPYRNEASTIQACLESLVQLKYPENLLEILLVNDNSEDNSQIIVEKMISNRPHFKSLVLTNTTGKKAALQKGITASKHKIIVTTDADCVYSSTWLMSLSKAYQKQEQPKMLIAPVLFKYTTFFDKIQALDFLSLTGSMVSTHSFNKYILCNGANLLFQKSAFYAVGGYKNIDKTPTGDDVLLLQKMAKKFPKEIKLTRNKNSVVYSYPAKNGREYLSQRGRWASKIAGHQSFFSKIVGIFVLFSNVFLLVFLVLAVVNVKLVDFFLLPFLLKCFIDFLFLFLVARLYEEKKLLWLIIVTEIFNMFAIPLITIRSFITGYSWKGRQY